ncbi:phosphoribosylglycinamide formyltransferase [Albirhodobacter sp. R86504]|uniref:phosphoribosylglycinamide formyltransferase n=1 Tax=Albirhodobacter sp. R86504 TaxID=3093848 RepID=UPI00366ECEB5
MKRVALLISGGGSNMVRLVEDMQAGGYGLPVLVGSNDPQAGGLIKARDLGVPTYSVDHKPFGKDRAAFEAEMLRPLLAAEPDVVCLAGYMRVLTPAFVDHFKGRMLNIHPSLLPKYPGLHTHARALEAGDSEAGCSVHEVTAILDDGPILGQARVPVLAGDSADDLALRVLIQEHRLYPAVLRRFLSGERGRLDLLA